ncbi:hypothetical protein [Microbacterium paraoxydans]|uniref:Uncharacterized protein n=1 Tax=Microbacterium paraoxydans TaxID=199592 RepID=A0ABS5INR8_9MICO|nr:hypothetical protein [Microbacterium paraoxydans]MBS0024032.1 hypothetical protein [Microbacterium paraoxydans]
MDGLTTAVSPAAPRRTLRIDALRHLAVLAGMLVLMVPALAEGHDSLAAVGAMFALLAWAAVAAGWRRVRGDGSPIVPGAVEDPFAMGLMMATPYLWPVGGGHGHGAGVASNPPVVMVLVSVLVILGWVALRVRAARVGVLAASLGLWSCLLMLIGSLIVMGVQA